MLAQGRATDSTGGALTLVSNCYIYNTYWKRCDDDKQNFYYSHFLLQYKKHDLDFYFHML